MTSDVGGEMGESWMPSGENVLRRVIKYVNANDGPSKMSSDS